MATFTRCDRCAQELAKAVKSTECEPAIMVGSKQGFLGPVPNLLDLCAACQFSLFVWLDGDNAKH